MQRNEEQIKYIAFDFDYSLSFHHLHKECLALVAELFPEKLPLKEGALQKWEAHEVDMLWRRLDESGKLKPTGSAAEWRAIFKTLRDNNYDLSVVSFSGFGPIIEKFLSSVILVPPEQMRQIKLHTWLPFNPATANKNDHLDLVVQERPIDPNNFSVQRLSPEERQIRYRELILIDDTLKNIQGVRQVLGESEDAEKPHVVHLAALSRSDEFPTVIMTTLHKSLGIDFPTVSQTSSLPDDVNDFKMLNLSTTDLKKMKFIPNQYLYCLRKSSNNPEQLTFTHIGSNGQGGIAEERHTRLLCYLVNDQFQWMVDDSNATRENRVPVSQSMLNANPGAKAALNEFLQKYFKDYPSTVRIDLSRPETWISFDECLATIKERVRNLNDDFVQLGRSEKLSRQDIINIGNITNLCAQIEDSIKSSQDNRSAVLYSFSHLAKYYSDAFFAKCNEGSSLPFFKKEIFTPEQYVSYLNANPNDATSLVGILLKDLKNSFPAVFSYPSRSKPELIDLLDPIDYLEDSKNITSNKHTLS